MCGDVPSSGPMRNISYLGTLRGEGLWFGSVDVECVFPMGSFNRKVPWGAGLSCSSKVKYHLILEICVKT